MEKLSAFVVEHMKAGFDKPTISQRLMERGIDRRDAEQVVESIHRQVMKVAKEEQITFQSILGALIGGSVAAVIGGAIWGLIVIYTGYVIGYMAWAIGGLAGFGVALFAGGKRGIPLQVVAVLASVLGILVGKYFVFFHYMKEVVSKEYGAEAASNLSMLSEAVIQFFIENIELVMSGFDFLWIIFAVVTAWRIPKGLGIKSK